MTTSVNVCSASLLWWHASDILTCTLPASHTSLPSWQVAVSWGSLPKESGWSTGMSAWRTRTRGLSAGTPCTTRITRLVINHVPPPTHSMITPPRALPSFLVRIHPLVHFSHFYPFSYYFTTWPSHRLSVLCFPDIVYPFFPVFLLTLSLPVLIFNLPLGQIME